MLLLALTYQIQKIILQQQFIKNWNCMLNITILVFNIFKYFILSTFNNNPLDGITP